MCLAFEGRMGRSLASTSFLSLRDVLNSDWEDFILLCQPSNCGSSCNSDEVIVLTCARHNCMSSQLFFFLFFWNTWVTGCTHLMAWLLLCLHRHGWGYSREWTAVVSSFRNCLWIDDNLLSENWLIVRNLYFPFLVHGTLWVVKWTD